MWEAIASAAPGRAIVLTTHVMEESEALCHRIGIMVGGRLRCLGSPQHLKAKFSGGFQIDARCEPGAVPGMLDFVQGLFPGADVEEEHGEFVRWHYAPADGVGLDLARVFTEFETKKAKLRIVDYAVSQATLERVFVGLASRQNEETAAVRGLAVSGGNRQRAFSSGAVLGAPGD